MTLAIRRAHGLPAVELHLGRAFDHSYPRHWHDELFVTAITRGVGLFRYQGDEHRADPGTLVLIAPGEVHSHASVPGGRSFRSLHAGMSLLSELAPDLAFRSTVIADARLFRRFLDLQRLLEKPEDTLRTEACLREFLVAVAGGDSPEPERTSAASRENAGVRRAREFLDNRAASAVALRDLASLAGMSPYHFHRLFRRQTGLPPHEYQIRRRVLSARRLLADGRPAADVAFATGFADQSHFTRHFRRVLGVSPARYARQSRHSKNVPDAGAALR